MAPPTGDRRRDTKKRSPLTHPSYNKEADNTGPVIDNRIGVAPVLVIVTRLFYTTPSGRWPEAGERPVLIPLERPFARALRYPSTDH